MAVPDLLKLLYQGTTWSGVATVVAHNVKVGLATGDPGDPGDTIANEADYTSYAAVNVAANGTNWEDNGSDGIQNAAQIDFPEKSGGADDTITYWYTSVDGTTVLHKGTISSKVVTDGVAPYIAAGELDTSVSND